MSTSHRRRVAYSQNFLVNPHLVERLVRESSLDAGDLVIEIGPGDGAITTRLLATCRHVIAVEKDPRQVDRLGRRLLDDPRLTLFAADFLEFPLPRSPYKVFASIPYNTTAAIVGKLTTGLAPPDDAYLVVQREAADRFIGGPASTLVAVQMEPWFERAIVHTFRRQDFRPVPAVDSVLLQVHRRLEPLIREDARSRYIDLTTAIFTGWKRDVRAALDDLMPGSTVHRLGGEVRSLLDCRPSEVPVRAWIDLFRAIDDLEEPGIWRKVAGASERLARQQAGLRKRTQTTVRGR